MSNISQSLLIAELDMQLTEARDTINRLQRENEELRDTIEKSHVRIYELKQELADIPKTGRPEIYDTEFRNRVKEYYNAGHTYRDTAAKFNISKTTVGKFLYQ